MNGKRVIAIRLLLYSYSLQLSYCFNSCLLLDYWFVFSDVLIISIIINYNQFSFCMKFSRYIGCFWFPFRTPGCFSSAIHAQNKTLILSAYGSQMKNICFIFYSGSLLLFRAVSSRVSSAGRVLTIVFGMGTGVAPCRIATGSFLSYDFFVNFLDNSTVK